MNARGWTLLELVFALGIIGLMLGAVGWGGLSVQRHQRCLQAEAQLEAMAAALQAYHRHWGAYPVASEADGAAVLYRSLRLGQGPNGEAAPARWKPLVPALADDGQALLDPWGTPYVYLYTTASEWTYPRFRLLSLGASAASNGNPEPCGIEPDGWLTTGYSEANLYRDNLVYGE
ncbi:MAG: type II secretion system protein GspG [Verrucomicrobiota bacterium JB022]|nr:type II secretion system protein GspG [Verrucomicrobiota bacterium JB022]